MRAEAVAAMLPYLTERFGNPSGAHAVARSARLALDDAREVVAGALGAEPGQVVFTGGGTEADNLAIGGVQDALGGEVICSAAEHHAVLHAVRAAGGKVVPVTPSGIVDLEALAEALGPQTCMVSLMLANNEVGVITPLAEVVQLVRQRAPQALVHTDAVQAFPWLDVATLAQGTDMVAVSAHKFGGPKGVGALVIRDRVKLHPILHGGGQEHDLRSGTHNVAGIVAMAAAAQATVATREETVARIGRLRDTLEDALAETVPGCVPTRQAGTQRIAGNCHLRFSGVEAEALLVLLDEAGVCASAGSACASGATEASHVLAAMGWPLADIASSLRLSLGWNTTSVEVEHAISVVPKAVARLRDAGAHL
jgi:cysteine desulfurase